jgi:hypothetical protein
MDIFITIVPFDYLRRFTAVWFRDVEKRPLTAIAKVAGTLIIVSSVAINVIHWFVA